MLVFFLPMRISPHLKLGYTLICVSFKMIQVGWHIQKEVTNSIVKNQSLGKFINTMSYGAGLLWVLGIFNRIRILSPNRVFQCNSNILNIHFILDWNRIFRVLIIRTRDLYPKPCPKCQTKLTKTPYPYELSLTTAISYMVKKLCVVKFFFFYSGNNIFLHVDGVWIKDVWVEVKILSEPYKFVYKGYNVFYPLYPKLPLSPICSKGLYLFPLV